jgi:hypothetical protein
LRRRDTVLTLDVWIAPGLVLALGIYTLMLGNVAEIGRLGLICALHPGLYGALTVLTASLLISLFRPRKSPSVLLAAHVVVFVILLFAAATIIELLPREISGWLHVGFADYIARTGGTLPELDVRFSSPGFWALVAMATRAAGMKDAMLLLGWTPVVLNLLYGAVVFRLARATSSDVRRSWLATWLFFRTNRVGAGLLRTTGAESPSLPAAFDGAARMVPTIQVRPHAEPSAHRHLVRPRHLGRRPFRSPASGRRGRLPPRPACRRWGDPAALAPAVAEDGAMRGAGYRPSIDESGSGSMRAGAEALPGREREEARM